ncbi:uncharacterized protein LOC9661449 isoform X1 [Selaginella moellendorffii]|uniref:uncharacterized protein LOC9661449 isoform X1 n=1 Tax=Selaginella moellendorffii TaxID=88036 RepID=UPI000D1CD16F|nr:uncharacterized protein LOC9661449 isoform X1 [Selaginella moellendorffii]XP_024543284.1 uncharacterized protein LOC9661449 isoform X1 [Selaginella moellendorffii]|eukprot:XP_024543283.1 uncharacterized protein LOC9661449 isoform X1 [Selaginella moellendorffii]
MPEHTTTSSGTGSPAYVEVFGSNGQTWRFAAGTKAGFAVRRIRSKLGEAAHHILCIAAFKENEEPVEFGPDAELVVYGDNWKLKLVQDPGHKEIDAAQDTKSALDDNPVQQHAKMHDLIAEFYPGGKVPRGSKPEFSSEYIGKVLTALALGLLLAAALKYLLEILPLLDWQHFSSVK